jgi:hypothetical protein
MRVFSAALVAINLLVPAASAQSSAGGPGQAPTASPASTTDASGTITSANTFQTILGSAPGRNFLQIHNPDASAPFGFAFNRQAVLNGPGTIMLAPGATVTYDARVPTGVLTIIGGTVGKPFTVYYQ